MSIKLEELDAQRINQIRKFVETQEYVMNNKASRFNEGKLQYASLPWRAIQEIAKVSTMGATKYGANNYKKGFTYSSLFDSMNRHLYGDYNHHGFMTGEVNDPESKLHHLAHAAWNLLVLLQQELEPSKYAEFDDRN